MMVIWDEIFDANSIEGKSDTHLCAAALSVWGHCTMGYEIHENFNSVLAAIGTKLNIAPTPENLTKWAKAHGFLAND